MNVKEKLIARSNSSCELCGEKSDLSVYEVPPSDGSAEQSILVCSTCKGQIENPESIDANHWRCLNESMWSTVPVVQVMAYRMLKRIAHEGWPQDLLDMLYLDEEIQKWALVDEKSEDKNIIHKDSNGVTLQNGDTVTIIKDLDVKGAGFTAKRGTAVRNISLTSNPEQIEGRVNGVKIILLTCFLKKS
ncbi:MAG: PhnA domain-containing protein [Sulfurospirillaceae bacterium]|nr:PhnA domain-containing protein [Sulfurospirillaceae bacterium]